MRDHVDSYYARTRTGEDPRPPLDADLQAEVCVVGGGLAGVSTALALAEQGVNTVLLEGARVGWGASGRNGGFVGAGFSQSIHRLIARLGREHAVELYGLSRGGVATVRERVRRYAIDCGPVVDGVLSASLFDDVDALTRQRDFLAQTLGEEREVWPRERLREAVLSERYHGALFAPGNFHFHPLNYSLGVARAAEELGVQIHEGCPVLAIDPIGAGFRVRTATASVTAARVVVTCGGYLERLVPRLARAIVPVATYVIATEPLGAERLASAIRVPYAISDERLANDYYRPLADTRILWGGRISVRRQRPPDLAESMRGDLLKVFPQLEGVVVETAWHGLMSYAAHKMPQIGELQPGLWYAMGFGGHGLNTTTMAGDLVATAIAKGDDRYRLFAPFGLAPTGGPLGTMAAQTTYWYYRLRDRMRGA